MNKKQPLFYIPRSFYAQANNSLEIGKPEITLSVEGLSNFTTASMTFEKGNADSVDSIFTFTPSSMDATLAIGRAENGTSSWSGTTFPRLYPAGKMTQNELLVKQVINSQEIEFSFILENEIIIEQPLSPAMVEFSGIPDSYTGELPDKVIGTGSSITVTLPEFEWTETVEKPEGEWSDYVSVETIAKGQVYGYKEYETYTTILWQTVTTSHKDYQYYEWTKFQSTYTGEVNIYSQVRKVARWSINGTEYAAGTTVTLDNVEGTLIATAVVEKVGGEVYIGTETTTAYKYIYGYVKGDEVKDKEAFGYYGHTPTGTKIGDTVTSQSGAYPSPLIADISGADANKGTIGTNTSENSDSYTRFWP